MAPSISHLIHRNSLADPLFGRIRDALAGEYDVELRLGAGGMASVYRAVDCRLGRSVAIKVLSADVATAATIERFRLEARILAQLEHPGVVRVHRAGERAGLSWYAMDLMPEGTLADRLSARPLSVAETVRMARDLASALGAVHAVGVIHRDLKPGNVFICRGAALLGDFGIARSRLTSDLTASGTAVGTPAYLPPEVRIGCVADERSDIWCLGATVYEAVTGSRWSLSDERYIWKEVPSALRPALRRALVTDPARRWQSAAEFAAAVREPHGPRWPWVTAAAIVGAAVAMAGLWRYVDPPFPRTRAGPAAVAQRSLSVVPLDSSAERLAQLTTHYLEWFPPLGTQPFEITADIVGKQGALGRIPLASELHSLRYVRIRRVRPDAIEAVIRDSAEHFERGFTVSAMADDVSWGAAIADSIAAFILEPAQLARYRELSRRGSANARAVEALLQCDSAFQVDEWKLAEARCNDALSRDSTFPQALWIRSLAHRWMRDTTGEDLRRLNGVIAELPEPLGRLVHAQSVWGGVARRDSLAAVVRANPGNETATFLLYDELFHRGPLVGVPLAATLAKMQAISDSNSDSDAVLWRALTNQLLWGYIRLGDEQAAAKVLSRRLQLTPAAGRGSTSESARRAKMLRLTYWNRFQPGRAALAMRLVLMRNDSSTIADLAKVFRVGGVPFDAPELQRQVGRSLAVRDASSTGERASGLIGEAVALTMLGRPAEARASFDAGLDSLSSGNSAAAKCEWRVALAAIEVAPLSPPELSRCRQTLNNELTGSIASRAAVPLALDAASRGDTAALTSLQRRLAEPGANGAPSVRLFVSAELASLRGEFGQALQLTELLGGDDSLRIMGGPFARAALFIRRGEWQLMAGRPAGAAREWLWHQNSDSRGWPTGALQVPEVDAMLAAYARLRRAELGPSGGVAKNDRCREQLRVLQLWNRAEPAAAPLVRRVEGATATLGCTRT